ncbi:hypothetical protein [Bauldia litoralis]|uniref:hypothetical protein n=1 Tax=Bauldia litoralis TaxID=665467 RepID=UPI001113F8B7|nr:hypothetical protein [Bauldia litoralis]
MDLIVECAGSELFHAVAPKISGRLDPQSEREELVTRFFVYSDSYLDFRHDVRKFLDQHVVALNNSTDERMIANKRAEFQLVMEFIKDHLPGAFYRPGRTGVVPRVRFEAITVGTALALRTNPKRLSNDLSWLKSSEFSELVRTDASNSGPKLRGRIEFVRDKLLGH